MLGANIISLDVASYITIFQNYYTESDKMRDFISSFLNYNNYNYVYQFGVFNGDSMYRLLELFAAANKPIKHMYGFDSFIGFPKTDENYQDTWVEGGLNAVEHMQCNDIKHCMLTILDKLKPVQELTSITLVPGFFSESLIFPPQDIGPAALIDIDVDLYSSAKEVLNFVVRNGILQPGTLLWYDDWGGSPRWKEDADGESLAHKEACAEYGLDCELLYQVGSEFPHVQRLYVAK